MVRSQISMDQVTLYLKQCQKEYSDIWGEEHTQEPKFRDRHFFSEKKLSTAFRSVQFLASFISFYFEILNYSILRVAKR